jgi:hypothetical protein
MPIVSMFAGAIGVVLKTIAGILVAKVLVSLGLSVVTYVGLDVMVTAIMGQAQATTSGMPANMLRILSLLHVLEIINLYLSAYIGGVLPNVLNAASFTRLAWKGPSA